MKIKLFPILLMLLCLSCYSNNYSPEPIQKISSLKNIQTQSKGKVTVTSAVLSDEESERIFGVDLSEEGIQPVWLKIENNDESPLLLFPIEIDPHYYSISEAARKAYLPDQDANREIDKYFHENSINYFIEPNKTEEGFIFTNVDKGIKEFEVKLIGKKKVVRFYFFFHVEGLKVDFIGLDTDKIYKAEDIVEYDEKGLHKALDEFQCCTKNQEGTIVGDPLNLVIIGNLDDFLPFFLKRDWDVVEDIYLSSVFKETKAFFTGSEYENAPMSSLYLYERSQDLSLQKARNNIYSRNHLRLWLSHMRYNNMPVWIGQISRDIGVSFTTKNWWLSTHDIDPHVDEARDYLVQDLLLSHGVKRMGYAKGFEHKSEEKPLLNFMEQPIITDGLIAVFEFTGEHAYFTELELFQWDWPENYKLNIKDEE
jgi:hypothetical protein